MNMKKADYQRQTGLVDIQEFRDNSIAIVGCGAIGSYVASSLAKMGLTKFSLYDFDKIEPHNLPNQFFKEKDIGKYKVECTAKYMKEFNKDVTVGINIRRVERTFFPKGSKIVISCVDSMEVRKYIFNKCKGKVQLFIDCRMGGLQGQVYSVDMTNKKEIKFYEKTLFKDSEAEPIRCTERSIIFTVLGIASIVCSQIIKVFKGENINNYIVLDYLVPQLF